MMLLVRRRSEFLLKRGFQSHIRSLSSSNEPQDSVIVQKFGGTSLGTPERMTKVANIISKFYNEEAKQNVVAVVSALSSDTKAEGTTSRLLFAADNSVSGKDFYHFLERIEDTHMDIVYSLLNERKIREEAKQLIQGELDRTRSFCESLRVIQELSPRSHDMIIGCGERLSAGLVSCVLRERGLKSVYVDLSSAFPEGLDTSKRGYQHIAKRKFANTLQPLVKDGVIPVVTGFFGNVDGGIIKGVGRGYTDLTGALCSAALHASAFQVWKESDGVFTGNPTKINDARLLSIVTPEEASELTYFGNEVLHPFTMECAIEDKVPIQILNTFKPSSGGTSIEPRTTEELEKIRGKKCKGIAAVCSKKGIPLLNIMSNRMLDSSNFLSTVFECFSKHNVKADLISTSVSNLTVTLHETTNSNDVEMLIEDLKQYGNIQFEKNHAIVSCIGAGMKNQRGLASHVFHEISNAGISLEMISQGASEINISVVIKGEDMDKAIHTIHKAFLVEE